MKIIQYIKICILLILIIFQANAHADTLPVGGRTASMGGAMTAFGHDSACTYINPAGLAAVPGNILSLSTSLYNRTTYTIENFYIPTAVDTSSPEFGDTYTYDQKSLDSSSVVGFPGSICYMLHLNKQNVLGFSVIIPEYDRRAFDGNLRLTFTDAPTGPIEMNMSDSFIFERSEYYFGPAYAMTIGPLRIGVSLFLLYRTVLNSVESTSIYTVYDGGIPNYLSARTTGYGSGTSFGFAPVAGAQLSIINNLYAGISFAPVMHLKGSYKGSARFILAEPDIVGDYVTVSKEEGTLEYNKPFRMRFGFGYEEKKSWAIAIDIEYIMKNDSTTVLETTNNTTIYEQGQPATREETNISAKGATESAFNLYAGGEYYLSNSWILRCGFFWMPSTNKLNNSADDILTLKIDRYGASIGLGNETEEGETTIGLTIVYGKGETIAGDIFSDLSYPLPTTRYERVNVTHFMIALSMSGTVDFQKF